MSLETALAETTAAINNLIAALNGKALAPEPAKDKPKAEKPEPKKETPPALDYAKDVAPKVIAFVEKHGKAKALAVLSEATEREIGHAKELTADEYAVAIAALENFAEEDVA